MDRSFLSRPEVVKASRKYTCIRLATYEDAVEARLLKSLFVGRTGDLENSLFVVLSPDGKTRLTAAARTPGWLYGDAQEMGAALDAISTRFRGGSGTHHTLPKLADVRLGLNVAACDNLPLIVALGKDPNQQRVMENALAAISWNDQMIGRAVYATTSAKMDLEALGLKGEPGYFVVEANSFGVKGRVLATVSAGETSTALVSGLVSGMNRFSGRTTPVNIRGHIEKGRTEGVYWDTVIPVTDPGPPGRGPGRP